MINFRKTKKRGSLPSQKCHALLAAAIITAIGTAVVASAAIVAAAEKYQNQDDDDPRTVVITAATKHNIRSFQKLKQIGYLFDIRDGDQLIPVWHILCRLQVLVHHCKSIIEIFSAKMLLSVSTSSLICVAF